MSSEASLDGRSRGLVRRALAACARAACSQLGLVVLVVVYVLLGALLFEYLESGPEVQKRSAIQRSREECLKELWAITADDNVENDDLEPTPPDLPSSLIQSGPLLTDDPIPGPSRTLRSSEAESPRRVTPTRTSGCQERPC